MKYLFVYDIYGNCVIYHKYNKLVEILANKQGYRTLVKEI